MLSTEILKEDHRQAVELVERLEGVRSDEWGTGSCSMNLNPH